MGIPGTPPRIDGKTVNSSVLQEQLGDDPPTPFSFLNELNGIVVCISSYMTYVVYTFCKFIVCFFGDNTLFRLTSQGVT